MVDERGYDVAKAFSLLSFFISQPKIMLFCKLLKAKFLCSLNMDFDNVVELHMTLRNKKIDSNSILLARAVKNSILLWVEYQVASGVRVKIIMYDGLFFGLINSDFRLPID